MLNWSPKSPGCWTSTDGIVFRQCPDCPKWGKPASREVKARKGAKWKVKTIMLNGSLSPRSVYEN